MTLLRMLINNLMFKEQDHLHKGLLGPGLAWLDNGTLESLHEASNVVQCLKITCLEEIAWRISR
ncbi:MAG: dTDP-glucose pyrophosphorylase [Psychroserpens sp.]|jgi:dTDP-glucose pyrophosphorylase